MDERGRGVTAFRLCVDLNVWVRQFLAEAAGRRGTASQVIVQAVLDGRAGVGPLQLVISHTMLSRLQTVMTRRGVDAETARHFTDTIASFALLGPAPEFPHLVLGGGAQPTREAIRQICDPYDPSFVHEPYDPEDGRVLDTALAGRADALVTGNFRDFAHYADDVVARGRVHIRTTAGASLWIVHHEDMARWLQTGLRPGRSADLAGPRAAARPAPASQVDPEAPLSDDTRP